jgi:hypothetical protein
MEHQQWAPVVLKRTAAPKPQHQNQDHANHMKKLDDDLPDLPKKCVETTSIQTLIQTRLLMKLTQKMADTKCAFPSNTFRDIEAKKIVPTEKQQQIIQKQFNVQLKIITK